MKIDIKLAQAVLEAGIDACNDMKKLHPEPEAVAEEDRCIGRIEWMLQTLDELAPMSEVIYDGAPGSELDAILGVVNKWQ